ncbi:MULTISPECIES: hypothetical protein [unclassified Streptomyces]|uniref:hypothetical protein n=1 Tax=unclassified Streptomyces TaxID=2593676 RepID=UPI0024415D4E|nr:hypothetical protein [Streptomyces sp. DH41]MDG9728759.1 hypothetical protein [Streptomyces sp. DH41]
MDEVEVVVAHSERATLRVGDGREAGEDGAVEAEQQGGVAVRAAGSARVPGILNVGKPEPACQLMAAAIPRAVSGLADGTW